MPAIRIGTSGWMYKHWRGGVIYPPDLPIRDQLGYYATLFSTVELNTSFYGLPNASTARKWRDSVPDRFTFAAKADRIITHKKKLKDAEEYVGRLLGWTGELGDKLGPILFQFPPRWRSNPERLRHLLEAAPRGRRYAFEFRDRSWFNEAVYEVLRAYNAACCLDDFDARRSPNAVTANFAYLRLHGPGGRYWGSYSEEALRGFATIIKIWDESGLDSYCYFNNDDRGYAVCNAQTLIHLVGLSSPA